MSPKLKHFLKVIGTTALVAVILILTLLVSSLSFKLLSAPNTIMNVVGALLLPTSGVFFGYVLFLCTMKKSKNI